MTEKIKKPVDMGDVQIAKEKERQRISEAFGVELDNFDETKIIEPNPFCGTKENAEAIARYAKLLTLAKELYACVPNVTGVNIIEPDPARENSCVEIELMPVTLFESNALPILSEMYKTADVVLYSVQDVVSLTFGVAGTWQ